MTTKTTTTRRASKASERPPTALIDALQGAGTASTPTPRKRAPRQSPARCAVPVHREAPGVLSARFVMPDHERAVIDAALTILGGYLRQPGAALCAPDAVQKYLRLQLGNERRELFGVIFVDSQNRVIAFEVMFVGTLNQTSVYPREVVLAALGHEAAAVVLVHNHPSGSTQPSRADEHLTATLKHALALVDVRVLDHVIVGGAAALSMASQGLM
jgi:proteasome lid subunit RPN8/RPN11